MDFKSLLIGALGSALLFFSVGAGIGDISIQEEGKYQAFMDPGLGHMYLLDTRTGALWMHNKPADAWMQRIGPNGFLRSPK